jgi:hypothetical protein
MADSLSFDSLDFAAFRPRGLGGPADLLLAYAAGGEAGLAVAAALLGYRAGLGTPVEPPPPPPPEKENARPLVVEEPPDLTPQPLAEVPFWRPERREFLKPYDQTPQPRERSTAKDTLPAKAPPVTELSRWSALLPRMRAAFARRRAGKAPDIEAMIRRLGKGRMLDRVPRRSRLRWGAGVQIIVDRGERLVPFDADQAQVASRLASLFPRHAVEFALAFDGMGEPVMVGPDDTFTDYRVPVAGTLVVVLGDLGCLASDPCQVAAGWAALGRKLSGAGCRPVPWSRARRRAGSPGACGHGKCWRGSGREARARLCRRPNVTRGPNGCCACCLRPSVLSRACCAMSGGCLARRPMRGPRPMCGGTAPWSVARASRRASMPKRPTGCATISPATNRPNCG